MKNKKQNYLKILGFIALIVIIVAQSNITSFKPLDVLSNNVISSNINNYSPKSGSWFIISIKGNDDLADFVNENGLSGYGIKSSPYIIEGFSCNASPVNGIDIRDTDAYIIIRNCNVEGYEYDHHGIYLNNTANVNITNNYITKSDSGIFVERSTNIAFSENNIKNNSNGISLYYSNYTTFSENNINNNIKDGLYLYESNNNSLFDDDVNNNKCGIVLKNSDNNIVSGDYTNNRQSGIVIQNSCNNVIFGNNIGNNNCGIFLSANANNNTIYFNDIYENLRNEVSERYDCSGNQWDNGTTGNYWGNYTDKYPDAKNDGIYWDTPYEIGGDSLGKDNFPLVNMVSGKQSRKISGFPIVNILFFISLGAFLLRRRIIHQKIRK